MRRVQSSINQIFGDIKIPLVFYAVVRLFPNSRLGRPCTMHATVRHNSAQAGGTYQICALFEIGHPCKANSTLERQKLRNLPILFELDPSQPSRNPRVADATLPFQAVMASLGTSKISTIHCQVCPEDTHSSDQFLIDICPASCAITSKR